VRNSTLHGILETFATDAAGQLSAETESGAEIQFELIEQPGTRTPLYCYRPLTGAFIQDRFRMLSALPTYTAGVQALVGLDGVEAYLRERGESRIPGDPRARAEAALRAFLGRVFEGRSEFALDSDRFDTSYAELERALYEGRCVSTVIAPLLGVALDPATRELALDNELRLVRGDTLEDAPPDAVWGDAAQPNVLALLRVPQERSQRPPVSLARTRFRRLLAALRLYERGGYAIGELGWARTDNGAWRPVPLGGSGRPRFVTFISAEREDELRGFCNLIARRAPSGGELAWALSRFEMGCERLAPFEALTDYLLALRALLEPEGPSSGRLAQRLAVLCARVPERAALAERTAHAISLERAVVSGLAPAGPGVDALVDEVAEHLRALLRDVLCGHLDPDLRGLADRLLEEAADAVQPDETDAAATPEPHATVTER